MAITLPSVVGRKEKKAQKLNVTGKDDILDKKENQRIKRREMLNKEMNKIVKDRF